MAPILDAILNFSKCSRVTEVHPADSERGHFKLPIPVEKKNYKEFLGSLKILGLATGLMYQAASDKLFID